jgi:hypothetical protein
VLEGVADLRGQVDWVGVGGWVGRLSMGRESQRKSEKEAEDFNAAFYCSSPGVRWC